MRTNDKRAYRMKIIRLRQNFKTLSVKLKKLGIKFGTLSMKSRTLGSKYDTYTKLRTLGAKFKINFALEKAYF